MASGGSISRNREVQTRAPRLKTPTSKKSSPDREWEGRGSSRAGLGDEVLRVGGRRGSDVAMYPE